MGKKQEYMNGQIEMKNLKKDSVERTLCIPLWSRAIAVKKLPQILPDYDAERILKQMGERKPPTVFYNMECAALAGAIRQYDLSCEINDYLEENPDAVIVELGCGLSCLRRQMKIDHNLWINIDLNDVIVCREKYIPRGENEKNLIADITDHRWFDEIPFVEEKGIIFLAAGVLHYLSKEDAHYLIKDMAEHFPGGLFVFDYVSSFGARSGNSQIRQTGNDTKIRFTMENAEKEISLISDKIRSVEQKSYLEGYPVSGVKYNPITKLYIRSKRKQYFVARVGFCKTADLKNVH